MLERYLSGVVRTSMILKCAFDAFLAMSLSAYLTGRLIVIMSSSEFFFL